MIRLALSLFGLALLFISPAQANAAIIFDSTITGTNHAIEVTSDPQFCNEVTAAGTARTVTELDIGFTSQGFQATANFQAFLYANDGAGGTPGTLLWQSAVMTGVSINSVNEFVVFTVPSIVVPNTFTFAASITNQSAAVGFVPASGATTGTFITPWVGSPGSYQKLVAAYEFEGRVVAAPGVTAPATTPEPASLIIWSLGGLGIAVGKWRRRKSAA
jgi:hypothetical protein